jgi:NADH-quinone oxidoreductase subunit J
MDWTNIYFYVCAITAVLGALATVVMPNPIRGAMGLLMMILSLAGLFLSAHAQFLAAIQLIVYAGAIVVLFLFVIMLLGPDATPPHDTRGRFSRTFAGAVFAVFAVGAMTLVYRGGLASFGITHPDADFGGIDHFGRLLFSYGIVPFELSSALLMVAVLGAVAVARGKEHASKRPAGHKTLQVPTTASAALSSTSTSTSISISMGGGGGGSAHAAGISTHAAGAHLANGGE